MSISILSKCCISEDDLKGIPFYEDESESDTSSYNGESFELTTTYFPEDSFQRESTQGRINTTKSFYGIDLTNHLQNSDRLADFIKKENLLESIFSDKNIPVSNIPNDYENHKVPSETLLSTELTDQFNYVKSEDSQTIINEEAAGKFCIDKCYIKDSLLENSFAATNLNDSKHVKTIADEAESITYIIYTCEESDKNDITEELRDSFQNMSVLEEDDAEESKVVQDSEYYISSNNNNDSNNNEPQKIDPFGEIQGSSFYKIPITNASTPLKNKIKLSSCSLQELENHSKSFQDIKEEQDVNSLIISKLNYSPEYLSVGKESIGLIVNESLFNCNVSEKNYTDQINLNLSKVSTPIEMEISICEIESGQTNKCKNDIDLKINNDNVDLDTGFEKLNSGIVVPLKREYIEVHGDLESGNIDKQEDLKLKCLDIDILKDTKDTLIKEFKKEYIDTDSEDLKNYGSYCQENVYVDSQGDSESIGNDLQENVDTSNIKKENNSVHGDLESLCSSKEIANIDIKKAKKSIEIAKAAISINGNLEGSGKDTKLEIACNNLGRNLEIGNRGMYYRKLKKLSSYNSRNLKSDPKESTLSDVPTATSINLDSSYSGSVKDKMLKSAHPGIGLNGKLESFSSEYLKCVNIELDKENENDPSFDIKGKKLNDATLKSYQIPFVSIDKKENEDNNNPEWEFLKKLNTDEERYYEVRKQWKNLTVPDPNVNLTYYSYRFRKNTNNIKGISRLTSKRKRDDRDDSEILPSSKKRKFCNLRFNNIAIEQTRNILIQDYEFMRKDSLLNNFGISLIKERFNEYKNQLYNAKEEAEALFRFYQGLPNQTAVSQEEIEMEQRDIEQVFYLFKIHYNWNGIVFNPAMKDRCYRRPRFF